jgi:hypothetical protein
MPGFGSKNLGSSSRATENIIEHDVQRDDDKLLVKETRDQELE